MFDGAAATAATDQHHQGDAAKAPEAPAAAERTTASATRTEAAVPTNVASAPAAPAAPAPSLPAHSLLVVDSRVEQQEMLTAQAGLGVSVLVVNSNEDGLAAISAALASLGQVDSIQILSHGAAGQFTLGNRTISSDNVDQLAGQLQGWSAELTADADIQLYGCSIGAGPAGQTLVNELARLTGADVGASADATGSASEGGNWSLETRAGDVDKAIALSAATLDSFQGLLAAAAPTVTLSSGGSDVLLGDTFTVTASFTNPSTQVGFAPYIDVFIPMTGKDGAGSEVDDGVTFVSATFEGQNIVSYVLTFDANGQATHPLAKDSSGNAVIINAADYGLRAGDQFVVLQLPNASIISGQPPVDIVMTFKLSSLADTTLTDGAPNLTVKARGGFQFGNTSADDPTVDPTLIEAGTHDFVVHPTMVDLTQTANVPDGQTVTGPNYPRSITVTASTASDQSLTNVVIEQDLPNTIIVTSIVPGANGALTSITLADGTVITDAATISSTIAAGAYLSHYEVTYSTMTGSVDTTVNFYVPEADSNGQPVLDPTSGAPRSINIDAPDATATWTPLDTRDVPAQGGTLSGSGDPTAFTVLPIVVYKEAAVTTDIGATGASPGDTLTYRLEVDISDYFAFGRSLLNQGSLVIIDEASNGQTLVPGSGVFTLTMNGQTFNFTITPTVVTNADGSTSLALDLAQTLRDNGQALAALVGDLAFDATRSGATVAVISYRTTISQNYDNSGANHPPINEGDSVGNNATVTGTVLVDQVNTGGTASDNDSVTIDIPVSGVEIVVATVNGAAAPADVELRPGDVVTFQISYDLLTGDYESFTLNAYLPLPLFNAVNAVDGTPIVWGNGTGINQWFYGPNHSLPDQIVAGGVTSDASGNFITFDFGDHSSPLTNGSRIEIRFTMVVGNTPFGDQRKVTVIAQSNQLTTLDQQPLVSQDAAIISSIAEPVLNISHGVVSSSAGTVSGVSGTWAPPLDGGNPFTAPVLDINDIDGDVSGIDGADYLRMATAIENSGGGDAYDVATRVDLPPGLDFVGGSLASTLRIFRGDGSEMVLGTDYSVNGNVVTFLDPTPGHGSLLAGRAGTAPDNSGENVVILLYDVQVASTIAASSTLESTAVLANYAAVDNGADFTPVDLTETAGEQVAAPSIIKVYGDGTLDAGDSSATHTTGSDLVVGETMVYDIVVTLPEGTATNLRIDDLIPPGLALDMSFNGGQGYEIIQLAGSGAGHSGALAADFAGTLTGGTPTGIGGTIGQDGVDGRISFTASVNGADNDTGNNSFVIRVRLVASNSPDNQAGRVVNNSAQITYSDPDGDVAGSTTPVDRVVAMGGAAPSVTVREPTLSITQTAVATGSSLGVDQGNTVTYNIVISNNSGVDAFDISFTDSFPTNLLTGLTLTGVTYSGTITTNGGPAVDFVLGADGVLRTATGANIDIANGGSITLVVTGTVTDTAVNFQTIDNKSSVQWTSINDTAPVTSAGGERTGTDGLLNSGVLNDYQVEASTQVKVLSGVQVSRIGGMADTPVASGGTDGAVEQVAVGEIVRYRVVAAVGEGVTDSYRVQVTLDAGLTFLPDGTIKIAVVSNGGVTSSVVLSSDGTLAVVGNRSSNIAQPIPTDLSNGPVATLATGRWSTTVDGNGRTVIVFDLGTVTNADNDADATDLEGVVIEFNARVSNATGNQNGTMLAVTAGMLAPDNSIGASDSVSEQVIEPSFTGLVKQVDSFTPNTSATTSTADMSVSFTQNGTGPAYDVTLDDPIFAGTSYTLSSVTIIKADGTTIVATTPAELLANGITNTSDANGIHLSVDKVDVGTKVVVKYSVTVDVNTAYASTEAELKWSSLPETFASWGGTAVGTDATADGERNGSDGSLNNYVLREGAGLGLIRGNVWDDSLSADSSLAPDGAALAGQTITLRWAGADGVLDNGDDQLFTTVTTSDGIFQFSGLAAGNYRVEAPVSVNLAQPTGELRVRLDTDGNTLGQVVSTVGEGATQRGDFAYVQINDAPVNTVPGAQSVDEDTLLNIPPITVGDVDLDQGLAPGVLDVTLTVAHGVLDFTATPSGTLAVGGKGSATITLSGTVAEINAVLATLTYKGLANYNGPDTLTITTKDRGSFGDAPTNGNGVPGEVADELQDVDTVAINVIPVNDLPQGNDDALTATEAGGTDNGTPGLDPSGNLLDNDTDVDIATNGDVLHLTGITFPVLGTTITIPANDDSSTEYAIAGSFGTLYVRANGAARYVVDNENPLVQSKRLAGQTLTEVFTYTLADAANAAALAPATLTITIEGANDTPVGMDDVGAAVEAGGTNNTTAGSPATGNVLIGDANGGVPDTDVDSASNGEVLSVTGVRGVPKDQAGAITAVTAGTPGSVAGLYGTLTLNADGSYSYVVNENDPTVQALSPGQTLQEVFSYQVTDAGGLQALANLTITINGADDAPLASDDVGRAQAGNAEATESDANGNVITDASRADGDGGPGTGIDTDIDSADQPNTNLTVNGARTGPESGGGTLTPLANGTITLIGTYGTLTLNADGSFVYDVDSSNPDVIAKGAGDPPLQDFFTYQIIDTATPGLTDTAQLRIDVFGINDPPIAHNVNAVAVEAGGVGNTEPGRDATGDVTSVSTDPDGDPLNVTGIRTGAVDDTTGTAGTVGQALQGLYGSLTINSDGTFTYVVNNDNPEVQALRTPLDALSERFTYTLNDSNGGAGTAEIVIRIVGKNDNPVAADDSGAIVEAGGINNNVPSVDATGNVLLGNGTTGADTDVDGGEIPTDPINYGETRAVTAVGVGSEQAPGIAGTLGTELRGTYGWLTLNADGSYSYRLDNTLPEVEALRSSTDTLQDSFHYTASDRAGATDVATLNITIRGANDAPVAADDAGTAIESGGVANGTVGSPATGNVLANDTDVDGGPGDPIDYGETKAVRDFRQGTANGTVGTPFTAQYGSLTLGADGNYTYVVDDNNATVQALRPGQTLTEVFTYTMVDAAGAVSTATLTITIQGADDTPVAQNDTATAVEAGGVNNGTPGQNGTGNVLTNDQDVDNPNVALSVSAVRTSQEGSSGGVPVAAGTALAGAYGTLTLNANGSYTYVVNDNDPAVQALRLAGNTLQDFFTYTVTDPSGQVDTAQLTITIQGANDNPVSQNDTANAIEAGGIANGTPGTNPSGNVLANDSDVDQNGETEAVQGFRQGLNLGTLGSAFAAQYGTLTLNADGSWTYLVDNDNADVQHLRTDAETLTEVFTYTMVDALGAPSTATLTITIHGRNDTPVANDDVANAVEAGGTFNNVPGTNPTGNMLTNDADADAGDQSVVNGIHTGAEGSGGAFTAVLAGGTTIQGQYGTLTVFPDGSYTYVVNNDLDAVQRLRAGDTLTESFTYAQFDRSFAADAGTLTINIAGAWDAPVAADDANFAAAGTIRDPSQGIDAVGNVLPNDTDVDVPDAKTVTGIGVGQEASVPALSTVGTSFVVNGLYGTLTINADGSYVYQVDRFNLAVQALQPGQHLDEFFTYQVSDNGALTDRAQLYIEVRGIDNPPFTLPDVGDAVEAGGLNNATVGVNPSGNVLDNDLDLDGDTLTITGIRTGPLGGTGTGGSIGQVLHGQWGDLVLQANGRWTYVVNNDLPAVQALRQSGDTLVDEFTYTVSDPLGETDTGLLSVVVHGSNDTPIAQDDAGEAVEAGGIDNSTPGRDSTGNVLDNDNDVDGVQYGETEQVQSYASAGSGAKGEAGSSIAGLYGSLVINADGNWRYVVDNNNPTVQAMRTSGESLTESFSYVMRDTAGATSQANLVIVVRGADDNPVARDDSNVATDQVVAPQATGNVLPNDSDVDGGDALHVGTIRTGPEAGSGTAGTLGQALAGRYGTLVINADGSYTYSIDMANPEVLAAAGFGQILQDVFTYTLVDRAGATDLAQLTIHLDISAPRIDPGDPLYFQRLFERPEPHGYELGYEPGIFVQPVVRQNAFIDRLEQITNDGTRPDMVLDRGLVAPPSLGAGMGQVAGQFVGQVVRENQLAAQLELARLTGRHGRVSLSADGLLPDPSPFSLTDAGLFKGEAQRPGLDVPPPGARQGADGGPRGDAKPPRAARATAPGFSEQLRQAAREVSAVVH